MRRNELATVIYAATIVVLMAAIVIPPIIRARTAEADRKEQRLAGYELTVEIHKLRLEAIERGHAEYVPDEHGNPTFRWREAQNEAE